jgi:hypothetical protein
VKTESWIGLVADGIVLAVVGAILRFATSAHSSGFNIHKVGDALLLVGGISSSSSSQCTAGGAAGPGDSAARAP